MSVGTLKVEHAGGAIQYFLLDRAVAAGEPIELRASGRWLRGRFECDRGTAGEPMFHFSVERADGQLDEQRVALSDGALLRWPLRSEAPAEVRRGDLFWASPASSHGSVPAIAHPHVVVQDDVFNRSRLETVIVCALTSNLARASEPGNVLLDEGEGGLERRSVVVVSQIASVAKYELGPRIGALSSERVDRIVGGLRFQQASFDR